MYQNHVGNRNAIWGHMLPDDRLPSCPMCGSWVSSQDERAEVIYIPTGARGIAHVECYLAEQDVYEIA